MNSVTMINNGKGGVGKSTVCNMMIEHNIKNAISTKLVETDTENPDVYNVFNEKIDCTQIDLKSKEGWIELINFIAENADAAIIINMAAGLGNSLIQFGSFFCDDLKELNRPLDMFWVINRQKDSIILLNKAVESLPGLRSKIVVKNLYWGDATKFLLWENSQSKENFENTGGITVCFPELNDLIADSISINRHSYVDVANKVVDGGFQFGHQRDLQRWTNDVFGVLDDVKNRLGK
jgi:hypothetical protein